MSLILETCVEYDEKRKICIAEENGKKYTLNNDSGFRIRKVKIDKCLFQEKGDKRCDYLLNVTDEKMKKAIFVELKGGDLVHALEQVYDSLHYLKDEFKDHQLDARIIGSRDVPGFINVPAYRKLERAIRKTGGTIGRSTNKTYTEKI